MTAKDAAKLVAAARRADIPNVEIARIVGCTERTISAWKRRPRTVVQARLVAGLAALRERLDGRTA